MHQPTEDVVQLTNMPPPAPVDGSHAMYSNFSDSSAKRLRSRSLTAALGSLLAVGFAGPAPGATEALAAEVVTSPIKLFDGTSLNGFYVWSQEHGRGDPNGVFKVENGMIHVAGEQPYVGLITEKEYRDYKLILEFKWGARTFGERAGKARDAGLLLHSQGADGGWRGRLMANIEAQIMEGSMGDLILLKGSDAMSMTVPVEQTPAAVKTNWNYRGGYRWVADGRLRTFASDLDTVHWSKWDPAWSDVAGFRGANDLEKRLGEWNQMVVVARGDRLEVYFNGEKVNEATGVYPRSGRIQLESEQAEYFVRRWELQPLDATAGNGLLTGAGRLTNLSVRGRAADGERTLIMGFVVGGNGSDSKSLLVRGVGPSLEPYGISGALADPELAVYRGGTVLAANDDWQGDAQVASVGAMVGAAPLASTTSQDAALVRAFAPGAYTVHVSGATGGVALAELFDGTIGDAVTDAGAQLLNASSRSFVGSGEEILIVGFVIGGAEPLRVLIRAVGPSLTAYGVHDVLENPQIELFSGGTRLQRNDDWWAAADAGEIATVAAAAGAFALPANSRDAAILASLPPGAYTAQVSGIGGATGVALAEIYVVR